MRFHKFRVIIAVDSTAHCDNSQYRKSRQSTLAPRLDHFFRLSTGRVLSALNASTLTWAATFCATARKAFAWALSGWLMTIGTPRSPPSRMLIAIGIAPRNGAL